jgi:ribonuclease HI/exonuclease III
MTHATVEDTTTQVPDQGLEAGTPRGPSSVTRSQPLLFLNSHSNQPTDMYIESQHSGRACLVHALNNALGRQALTLPDAQRLATDLEQLNPAIRQCAADGYYEYGHLVGAFAVHASVSVEALQYYEREGEITLDDDDDAVLPSPVTTQTGGGLTRNRLRDLRRCIEHHPATSFIAQNELHAVAIRRFRGSHYVIDSMGNGGAGDAIELHDDASWDSLRQVATCGVFVLTDLPASQPNTAQSAIHRARNAGEAILMGLGEPITRTVLDRARNAVEAVRMGLEHSAPAVETIHPRPLTDLLAQPEQPTGTRTHARPIQRRRKHRAPTTALRAGPPEWPVSQAHLHPPTDFWGTLFCRPQEHTIRQGLGNDGREVVTRVAEYMREYHDIDHLPHSSQPVFPLCAIVNEERRGNPHFNELFLRHPEAAIDNLLNDISEGDVGALDCDLLERGYCAAASRYQEVAVRVCKSLGLSDSTPIPADKWAALKAGVNARLRRGVTPPPITFMEDNPPTATVDHGPEPEQVSRRDGTSPMEIDWGLVTEEDRRLSGTRVGMRAADDGTPAEPKLGTLTLLNDDDPPFIFKIEYDTDQEFELLSRSELLEFGTRIVAGQQLPWPDWEKPTVLRPVAARPKDQPRLTTFSEADARAYQALPPRREITTVTWNVQGPRNYPSLVEIINESSPEIIFLTETHTRTSKVARLQRLSSLGYSIHTSSSYSKPLSRHGGRPKGGVAIMVRNDWAHPATLKATELIRGNLLTVDVEHQGGAKTTLAVVYVPTQSPDPSHAAAVRGRVRELAREAGAIVLAGDFNGAPAGERDGAETPGDREHQKLLEEIPLCRTQAEEGRTRSRTQHWLGQRGQPCSSRIDDVLTSRLVGPPITEQVIDVLTTSTHAPLVVTLLIPPPTRAGTTERRRAGWQRTGFDTDRFTSAHHKEYLRHLNSDYGLTRAVQDGHDALGPDGAQGIEETARLLSDALVRAQNNATFLPRYEARPKPPGDEAWLSARERATMTNALKAAKDLTTRAHRARTEPSGTAYKENLHPDSPMRPYATLVGNTWAAKATEAAKAKKQESAGVWTAARARQSRRWAQLARTNMLRNRKKATRRLFGGQAGSLHEVLREDGTVASTPDEVKAAIADAYDAQFTPSVTDLDPAPPWSPNPTSYPQLDAITLETDPPVTLRGRITDIDVSRVLQQTPLRRAAGPDGILGETLRALPPEAVRLVTRLFQRLYDTGTFPSCLAESQTTLLFKPGKTDTRDINNYRPIALAPALARAYTRLLTSVLSDYAEERGILSDSQFGFRANRSTGDAIRLLSAAFEDATLMRRDVWVSYFDFSKAFDTINHTVLFRTMAAQGFPQDAIDAVRAVTTGRTTRLMTPHGHTRPVHINQGCIQGDALSPLLFSLLIDPLLRWLENGGRGYPLATSPGTVISAIGYADDLTAASASEEDLRIQHTKVARFGEYTGLRINTSKCRCTGLARGRPISRDRAAGIPFSSVMAAIGKIVRIPWLGSDQPYTYLGVQLTATLSSKHEVIRTVEKIVTRTEKVVGGPLALRQKLTILSENIVAAAKYARCAGSITLEQTKTIDLVIARCAKALIGAASSTAGPFVFLGADKLGWGIRSLREAVLAGYPQQLVDALRDVGTLGTATRGILREHLRRGGEGNELRFQDSYTSALPTANMFRVAAAAGFDLVAEQPVADALLDGIGPVAGGRLLTALAPRHTEGASHARTLRSLNGRLARLWAAGCYTVADITIRTRTGQFRLPGPDSLHQLLIHDGGRAPPRLNDDPLRAPYAMVAAMLSADGPMTRPGWALHPDHTPAAAERCRTRPARAASAAELLARSAGNGVGGATRTPDPPNQGGADPDDRSPGQPAPAPQETRATEPRGEAVSAEFFRLKTMSLVLGSTPPAYKIDWENHTFDTKKDALACLRKFGSGKYRRSGPGYGGKVARNGNAWDVVWEPSIELAGGIDEGELQNHRAASAPARPPPRPALAETTPTPPQRIRPGINRETPLERTHPGKLKFSCSSPDPTKDAVGTTHWEAYHDDEDGVVTLHSPTGEYQARVQHARLAMMWDWWTTHNHCAHHEAFYRDTALSARFHFGSADIRDHWVCPPPLDVAICHSLRGRLEWPATEMFSHPFNASPAFPKHRSYREADKAFGFKHNAYSTMFTGPYYANPEYQAEELLRTLRWAASSATFSGQPCMGVLLIPEWTTMGYASLLDPGRPTRGIHVLARLKEGFRFVPYTAWMGGTDNTKGTKWNVLLVLVYNRAGYEAFGDGLKTADGLLATSLKKANNRGIAMIDDYRPPPPLTDGPPSPPTGRSARGKSKLLARPPPGFAATRNVPANVPTPEGGGEPAPTFGGNIRRPQRLYRDLAHVYTDGSKPDDTDAGSAAFFADYRDSYAPEAQPFPGVCSELPVHRDGAYFAWRFEGVQNAYRAELIAILGALKEARDNRKVVIFTDSMSSLLALRKTWLAPHRQQLHHELPILREITQLVTTRGYQVHIVKVKGHAGVAGNEIADRVAVMAANEGHDVPIGDMGHPSTHVRGVGLSCSWKALPESMVPPRRSGDEGDEPGDGSPFQIYNVKGIVPTLAKKQYEEGLLGPTPYTSNAQPRIVVRQVLGGDPDDPSQPHLRKDWPHKMAVGIIEAWWTNLPARELRTTLRVRAGNYFAGMMAYRAGATPDEFCTVCKSRQAGGGWEHTVTACVAPAITALRVKRHNVILQRLRDAVAKSTKGNADITCDLTERYTEAPTEGLPDDEYAEYEADVCEEPLTDEAAYGLEPDPTGDDQFTEPPTPTVTDGPYLERSRTVPADLVGGIWAETITRDDGTEYRHVSPDMLIIRRGPGRTVTRVDIVDVTVCLHHRFGAAHKAKEEAYEPLRRAIIAHKGLADDKVTVRALALGVWGHIPESALATLRARWA